MTRLLLNTLLVNYPGVHGYTICHVLFIHKHLGPFHILAVTLFNCLRNTQTGFPSGGRRTFSEYWLCTPFTSSPLPSEVAPNIHFILLRHREGETLASDFTGSQSCLCC